MYKYLKGSNTEEGARLLFSMVRSNRHKFKNRKFYLNTRKCFFTVRVVSYSHRFCIIVVESPSLKIFKTLLDMILDN